MLLTAQQQADVLRTVPKDIPSIVTNFNTVVDFAHGAIGLMTELGEYRSAQINKDRVNGLEELSDMLWYIELIKEALTITYNNSEFVAEVSDHEAFMSCTEVLDWAKRCIYYGQLRKLDEKGTARQQLFLDHLKRVQTYIIQEARLYGCSYSYLADGVVAKLKKRYPDSFTEDSAVKRDLDAEYSQLELDFGEK